jgi:transcriptional regulator of heat shock response
LRRIAYTSRLPDRKDKQLQRASEIVSLIIKKAVDRLSSLHDNTPYWLRTANSTKKVENRPIVRLQNEDSLDRYIIYVRRFACYLLRVYIAQKERGDSKANRSSDKETIGIENKDIINNEAGVLANDDDDDDIEAGTQRQIINRTENNVIKDCYKLTKLNTEQRERLQDMLGLLESSEDKET